MARRKHRCADLAPLDDAAYHLDRMTFWVKVAAVSITVSLFFQLGSALGWW